MESGQNQNASKADNRGIIKVILFIIGMTLLVLALKALTDYFYKKA